MEAVGTVTADSLGYFESCGRCSICRRELFLDSNPQFLPCLHTCCGQCLDDVKAFEVESNSVTNDRTPESTSNSKSDKDNFPRCEECKEHFKSEQCMDNIFLLKYFLDVKKGRRSSESDSVSSDHKEDPVDWETLSSCASCEQCPELVAYCKECEGGLCGECLEKHGTMKIFRTHEPKERRNSEENKVIEQFVKRYSTCKFHEKEQYSLYCLLCDEVTCKECLILNHKDHRWENINEMKQKFVNDIASSRKHISEKRELVLNSLKVLEQRQNQLNSQQKAVRNDILLCANKLKAAVEELSQSLFEELTKRCETKNSEYAKSQANLKSTEESLRFVETFLSEIVENSFPVALLFTKKLIQSQIANLLQRQCSTPNASEDFELKLKFTMGEFNVEDIIKTSFEISSSNRMAAAVNNNAANTSVNGERIGQKRNSADIEIISTIPPPKRSAQPQPPTNPLAGCKQCVDNVQFADCATSSLSYSASAASQNVPSNYSLHSPLVMNAQPSAYPVMYSGHANTTPQHYVNQVPSSGAHTSGRIYPPNVSLTPQPPRYQTIHHTVPNQNVMTRAALSQPVQMSKSTLPNVYFIGGNIDNFPATFAATPVTYHQQPTVQTPQQQQSSSYAQRRDVRPATRVGQIITQAIEQQFHLQSAASLVQSQATMTPSTTVTTVQLAAPLVQPKSVLSDVLSQPLQKSLLASPAVPQIQQVQQSAPKTSPSPQSQVARNVNIIMEEKLRLQKQSVRNLTLLPPSEAMESTVQKQSLQNGSRFEEPIHARQVQPPRTANGERECNIYPPSAPGQQSKGTTQQTSSHSPQKVSAPKSNGFTNGINNGHLLMRNEKTYSRIQSPPSPISKATESPEKVSSTVASDTQNGVVTSSNVISNITPIDKIKVVQRKEFSGPPTEQIVSTTENGYNITFTRQSPTYQTNSLSSDTEIMHEANGECEDDEIADNDEWCSVCKDGGELLCCDSCPRAFHMHCHVPSLKTIPQAAWTCQLCNDNKRIQNGGSHNGSLVGPNAAHVNEMACQRILLELFCHKESAVISTSLNGSTEINLSKIKLNLECKANYTESDFIREINEVFRHFYSKNKSRPLDYESGINLEKFFKQLVEKFLPNNKSMIKVKLWELGSNCRPKKGRF